MWCVYIYTCDDVFLLCRSLRKLNIEGNQLSGLPYPAASLSLTQLLAGDNLMHPLLWRENTRNQPQVSHGDVAHPAHIQVTCQLHSFPLSICCHTNRLC